MIKTEEKRFKKRFKKRKKIQDRNTKYLSKNYKDKTQIIQICNIEGKKIKVIKEKIEGIIILKTTSFVFEVCGQISDRGYIYNKVGKFKVYQVTKYKKIYLHRGRLLKGYLISEDNVSIYIDKVVRYKISINHSAIHLLNETLKRVLKTKIKKKGMLITEKKITFDFNYFKKISNETLIIIEQIINNDIIKQKRIFLKQISKQVKKNIKINVVFIGNDGRSSLEICNGTHIKTTKTIGYFCIVSEKSLSKGRRRIEALTNKTAIHYLFKNNLIIRNLSNDIKHNIQNLEKHLRNIITRQKIYIDDLKLFKQIKIKQITKKLLNQMFYLFEYKILINKIKLDSKKDLVLILNKLVTNLVKKSIIILYVCKKKKIDVFIKLTKDCLKFIQYSVIVKHILKTKQIITYFKTNDVSYIKTSIKTKTVKILYNKTIKTNIKNTLIK